MTGEDGGREVSEVVSQYSHSVTTLTHRPGKEEVQTGSDWSEPVHQFWTLAECETGLSIQFSPWPELWTELESGSAKFRSRPKFRTEPQYH